jgi:adenylosuccinate synthase
VGEQIRQQGHEFGTTTGRPRRCGWLDLVALKAACRINSMSGLILTRLDVLAGIDELKVCTAYELDGEKIEGLPLSMEEWTRAKPVYETLPGWHEQISGCRKVDDLPATTRAYVEFVEEFTETPAAILSIGPDRSETLIARRSLIWG